ncbi:ABC transporter permease [Lichenicoccus sp.]|uniref:ABC transporter permease n=1 Tax=Lichenicoccus sp. TaxID=2781899 RepID=UPI003D11C23A
MLAHALLSFTRNLARHRFYAAINVLGLAVGIAVFLVLMLVVRYENSFDRWLPHANDVYRLDTTWTLPGEATVEFPDTSYVALPLLLADFPEILAGARLSGTRETISIGRTVDSQIVQYTDPSFFNVIALPLVAGSRRDALAAPGDLVINQSLARKYFGTTRVIGRTLDMTRDGHRASYIISAVMKDLPTNTTLEISMLTPLTPAVEKDVRAFRAWGDDAGPTYLRFKNRADARRVAAALRAFVARRAAGSGQDQLGVHPEDQLKLSLVKLTDAHFHLVGLGMGGLIVDPRVVFSLGAVGVLALLIAAINTVNLATARAGLRAREVALRKVMGASRRALLVQFLGESTALVALSAVIGLAGAELAVPMLNTLGGWSLRIDYPVVLSWLALLVLVVGIGAGLYPALLLANYRPAAVLASVRLPSGGRLGQRLRTLLVLIQFACATGFAICTLVINVQANFLRRADRGFDRQGLILVLSTAPEDLEPRQRVILDAFRGVPGVTAVTESDRMPDSTNSSNQTIFPPGWTGQAPSMQDEQVGPDYFRTYGVQLLAGRVFDAAHGDDDQANRPTSTRLSTVLNRKAALMLGCANPGNAIGHSFGMQSPTGRKTLTIIGVVRDVRFMSPHDPIAPEFYLYNSQRVEGGIAAVRFQGVSRQEILGRLQAVWRKMVPGQPFRAETANQRLSRFYRPDQQRARLFSMGSILALAIAAGGLYGLAAFGTARRMQEIGIRKVLGASATDMLLLLVGQFVRPVLFANLIAWPVAWAAMRIWLSGFNQRIGLSPGYFVVVTVIAVAISILTVLGQAWRVARAEPARALRYE